MAMMTNPVTDTLFEYKQHLIQQIEMIDRYDDYHPLYTDHPIFGSAEYCSIAIQEGSGQRSFTKVRYRLPQDGTTTVTEWPHTQAYYRSSGYNTGILGEHVWFPTDGIGVYVDFSKKEPAHRWIIKATDSLSAKHVRRRKRTGDSQTLVEIATRFCTPLFVFQSSRMQSRDVDIPALWRVPKHRNDLYRLLSAPFTIDTLYEPPPVILQQYDLQIDATCLDEDYVMNYFIDTAISYNHLFNIPGSSFADEYPDRKVLTEKGYQRYSLSLRDILNEKPFRLHKYFEPHILVLLLPNGSKLIPEFVIKTSFHHLVGSFEAFWNHLSHPTILTELVRETKGPIQSEQPPPPPPSSSSSSSSSSDKPSTSKTRSTRRSQRLRPRRSEK